MITDNTKPNNKIPSPCTDGVKHSTKSDSVALASVCNASPYYQNAKLSSKKLEFNTYTHTHTHTYTHTLMYMHTHTQAHTHTLIY